jgi:hypothetical protein
MKLLIVGVIVIGVIGISVVLLIGTSVDTGTGQKYQYKFWPATIQISLNTHNRVFFSHSNDYGQTFSEPRDMTSVLNAHEPKMIVMDDDVILVWRDEIEDEPTLSFAKSTDFGETFEIKRLFYGGRADIVHYGETLYLTYADTSLLKIWYSKSNDRGETFSEPKLIFEVDWKLSPYEGRPTPTLAVDADNVMITWGMKNKDKQYAIWNAIDYGKDDSFDVKEFLENRD